MDVITYLEQVEKYRLAAEYLRDEYERVSSIAMKVTASENDGMPHAPGISDKTGNGAVNLSDIMLDINKAFIQFYDYRRRVNDNLRQLPTTQYEVLYKRYFDCMKFCDIAESMGYTEQGIYKIRTQGLKNLSKITGYPYIV